MQLDASDKTESKRGRDIKAVTWKRWAIYLGVTLISLCLNRQFQRGLDDPILAVIAVVAVIAIPVLVLSGAWLAVCRVLGRPFSVAGILTGLTILSGLGIALTIINSLIPDPAEYVAKNSDQRLRRKAALR